MPIKRPDELPSVPAVVTYPRDAILDVAELQRVLRISRRKIEKLDLPCFYVGRDVRYIWGQVFDYLAEKAKLNAAPVSPLRRIG